MTLSIRPLLMLLTVLLGINSTAMAARERQVRDGLETKEFPFDLGKLKSLEKAYFQNEIQDILRQLPQSSASTLVELHNTPRKTFSSRDISVLQDKIDSALEFLVATPTGQWYLQRTLFNRFLEPNHPDVYILNIPKILSWFDSLTMFRLAYFSWGMSRNGASKLSGDDPERMGRSQMMFQRTSRTKNGEVIRENVQPRNYLFDRGGPDFHVDAYSGSSGITYVSLIDQGIQADIRLLSVLIHELAITGDYKNDLTMWLTDANGDVPDAWVEAASSPQFLTVFSALRAFRIESMFFQDFIRLNPGRFQMPPELLPFQNWDAKKCAQVYHRLVDGKWAPAMGMTASDRARLHQLLPEGSTIPFGRHIIEDACLHLSHPVPGERSLFISGPRPRIGGW